MFSARLFIPIRALAQTRAMVRKGPTPMSFARVAKTNAARALIRIRDIAEPEMLRHGSKKLRENVDNAADSWFFHAKFHMRREDQWQVQRRRRDTRPG